MPRRKNTANKKEATKTVEKKEIKTVAENFTDNEKIEREKLIAMWAGVIFFMLIIFFFWGVSFKNSIKSAVNNSSFNDSALNSMADFKNSLEKTKNDFMQLQQSFEENTSVGSETEISESELKELEQRLNNMEQELELEKFLYKFNKELSAEEAQDNSQ